MKSLSEQILSDSSSGVLVDSSGRRYFKQRQVHFQPLNFTAEELHGRHIPGIHKEIHPPDWNREPSHLEILAYAREASERFLLFWYRVFDVAIARGLSGRDREIFRSKICEKSSLIDTGIPEDPMAGSCPPSLSSQILAEYNQAREIKSDLRLFYITEYLEKISDDVIEAMKPYHRFWDLERERREMIKLSRSIVKEISPGTEVEKELFAFLDRILKTRISVASKDGSLRRIASDQVRKIIFRFRQGDLAPSFNHSEREALFLESKILRPGPLALRIYAALKTPVSLYDKIRSGAFHLSSRFRLELRLLKLRRYRSTDGESTGIPDTYTLRIERHESKYREILNQLEQTIQNVKHREAWTRTASFFSFLETHKSRFLEDSDGLIKDGAGILEGKTDQGNALPVTSLAIDEFSAYLKNLRKNDDLLISHYALFNKIESPLESRTPPENPGEDTFTLPNDMAMGDPFLEREAVDLARKTLKKRLRPIRMAAGAYSTIADERHAAISLNPIMRLWKDRPGFRERDIPRRVKGEFNTKAAIESLLQLAFLGDPQLPDRVVHRGKILQESGKRESIRSMNLFLTPGSCFPLREVNRFDFPEFRGRVIGESRNPTELGVSQKEESILTGAWYSKRNHSLYYPVGGDNGSLLYSIWKSARIPGPPAFFFALGQFVHDTLPDNLVYYKSTEIPFRLIVEDYYRREDLTRKNRGEKTGRKKADNSREGVRFMFAVAYSRYLAELLTGSPQASFRHRPMENWFMENIGFSSIFTTPPERIKEIRRSVRKYLQLEK